jgi:uncharacterized membrane protein YeaQ/YmgE (transglycosylase-associated protein family)
LSHFPKVFRTEQTTTVALTRMATKYVGSLEVQSIAKLRVTLDDDPDANERRENMFHLVWYILIGLVSGFIAKSVMHVHMTMFWTIVLGIIGSILGGAVTHIFLRPKNERYHPAGLIFSTLGAVLILYICYKLKIHFPEVLT